MYELYEYDNALFSIEVMFNGAEITVSPSYFYLLAFFMILIQCNGVATYASGRHGYLEDNLSETHDISYSDYEKRNAITGEEEIKVINLSTRNVLQKFLPTRKPRVHQPETKKNLFKRVRHTLTRSHDAVWASLSLTFICVLLVIMVGYSKMWKTYRGNTMHVKLAFSDAENNKIPFSDVLNHKKRVINYFNQKWKNRKFRSAKFPRLMKKNKNVNIELKSLLPQGSEDSATDEELL